MLAQEVEKQSLAVISFGPELSLPHGKWVSPTTGERLKISDRVRRFVDAYVGPAKWNATEAAKMVGYSHPSTQGPATARKYRELIDWWVLEHKGLLVVGPVECMEILASIARNPKHKDQLRAVELAMKAHGLLSEKLLISTDRRVLESQVAELAQRLVQGRLKELPEASPPIEAEFSPLPPVEIEGILNT